MGAGVRHETFDLAEHSDWGGWTVNGQEINGEVSEQLNEQMNISDVLASECPYCKVRLLKRSLDDRDWEDEDEGRLDKAYTLAWCGRCAHWEFSAYEGTRHCMGNVTQLIANSVAQRFDPSLPEGLVGEMAQQLRRHPKLWHEIAPRRLETLVAEIFKANFRHVDVVHLGRPGDGGVDVLFIDDEATRWLVQVKRRENARTTEGFSTLQSLLGTLLLEGDRHGIVVTTADSFSHYAKRKQSVADARGYTVELIDRATLDRLLGPLIPDRPWTALVRHPSVIGLSADVAKVFEGAASGDLLSAIPERSSFRPSRS
jgi:hypothetical protein